MLPGASEEVEKQVLKNLITTSTFVFLNWKAQRETIGYSEDYQLNNRARAQNNSAMKEKNEHIPERYLNDDW